MQIRVKNGAECVRAFYIRTHNETMMSSVYKHFNLIPSHVPYNVVLQFLNNQKFG